MTLEHRILITRKSGDRCDVLLSEEDVEWASQFRWHIHGTPGYAARRVPSGLPSPRQRVVFLHREILERMGHRDFEMADHIDRNSLNNCRDNLRPADAKINANNRVFSKKPGPDVKLPDPEPRACVRCGAVYTPIRKTKAMKSTFCSRACQRFVVLGYSDSSRQRARSLSRGNRV